MAFDKHFRASANGLVTNYVI